MVNVRHGLMVVGYSYAGKSSALSSLARGLTTLAIHGLERKTQLYCMNPGQAPRPAGVEVAASQQRDGGV